MKETTSQKKRKKKSRKTIFVKCTKRKGNTE